LFGRLFKTPLSAAALVLVVLALLLPVVAWLGYRSNLSSLERMLYSKGSALVEAVLHESENALLADREITDLLTAKLAQTGRFALQGRGAIGLDSLAAFADLARIDLYSQQGELAASSDPAAAPPAFPKALLDSEYEPGVHTASVTRSGESSPTEAAPGDRYYTVTVSGTDGRLAACYLDAEKLVTIRRRLGIGLILDDLASVRGVRYAVLQDTLGIIAASLQVVTLESISGDKFFPIPEDEIRGRYTDFEGEEIYELASPFTFEGEDFGYLRLGLATDEIRAIAGSDRNRFMLGIVVLMVLLAVAAALYLAGQKQLRLELEHLRIKGFSSSVLESMAEAVIVLDEDGRVVQMNESCGKLCGCGANSSQEGRPLAEINPALAITVRGLDTGGVRAVETSLPRPGCADTLPVLVTASPLTVASRRYLTVILTDLTDRKQAQELALRSQRYQTMAEVSAGVAHEIRNPLNAIGMNVQRLKLEFAPEGPDRPEFDAFVETIRAEVERLNGLVEQFLQFSRFPHPRFALGRLDRLLEETLSFLEPELAAVPVSLSHRLEPCGYSSFDPDQLRQVLVNLVQNAAQAAGPGGKVDVGGCSQERSYRVSVSDNGPGIPQELREKIFEPFFSTRSKGIGLGLAIVSRIIAEHGGMIGVEEGPAGGTAFVFTVPLGPGEILAEAAGDGDNKPN